ncbi:hypothetical protein [Crocosphaera sp. Alani8]|uniref:hypothetical protein n=1 Tax=Crocosphaera sp. Alani8 TaxID=3038952 RepID=UPI00313EE03B
MNYIWPAFVSMVILSAIVASLPNVLANEPSLTTVETLEPPETPTGTWEDLEGLESQTNQQWSWDVQESDGIISENLEYELSTELSPDSPTTDAKKDHEDWDNSNRGDPKSSGGLIPFADF